MAACGSLHTITLSNDGTLHSFGHNNKGQLGLGHNNDVSLPTLIPNLPKINMISCGLISQFVWTTKVLCGHLVIMIMTNSEQETKQNLIKFL